MNIDSFSDLYCFLLYNGEELSSQQFTKFTFELKLISCAKFLKHKFTDKRTIPQLVKLIKEEYGLV